MANSRNKIPTIIHTEDQAHRKISLQKEDPTLRNYASYQISEKDPIN